MSNEDKIIQQFMQITGCDNDVAKFFLESSKWDIETAMSSYYAEDRHADEELESELVEAVGETRNNVHTGLSKQSKNDKNIVTFSSFRNQEDEEDEDAKGQAFYVGGSERGGGGQQVLGPPKASKNPPDAEDVFRSAQSHGAELMTSPTTTQNSKKPFSGSGYRLGDNVSAASASIPTVNESQASSSNREVEVVVRLWRDGFTVDDGELRCLKDRDSMEFLRSLSKGEIPSELLEKHKFAKINLNMENRSDEEYSQPQKPKVVPFQGEGRMLGSPTPNVITEPIKELIKQNTSGAVIKVDETQPITQLQIRLANNEKLVMRLNHSHTIGDIREHLINVYPQYSSGNFNLMTTFPNKVLADNSLSVKEANLLNAVISQRLT